MDGRFAARVRVRKRREFDRITSLNDATAEAQPELTPGNDTELGGEAERLST